MILYDTPFVRHCAKSTYFIKNDFVAAIDCRILYILSGNGLFETYDNTYALKPGTLLYFPYGTPYRISELDENQLLFYVLNFDFSSEYTDIQTTRPIKVSEFSNNRILKTIHKDDTFFSNIIYCPNAFLTERELESICNEYILRDTGYRRMQSSHLEILLIQLYRMMQQKGQKNELVSQTKKIIDNNCTLNINQIAEMLGYHPYYISSAFKKHEQITLHQYIMKQRLHKALSLISETHLPLEEIARRCGFCSQSHLTRSIKKEYGMTPKEIRF